MVRARLDWTEELKRWLEPFLARLGSYSLSVQAIRSSAGEAAEIAPQSGLKARRVRDRPGIAPQLPVR